jgi:hypothetical protein
MSILLMTSRTGLLVNRGLIDWNSLHWSSVEKLRFLGKESVAKGHT